MPELNCTRLDSPSINIQSLRPLEIPDFYWKVILRKRVLAPQRDPTTRVLQWEIWWRSSNGRTSHSCWGKRRCHEEAMFITFRYVLLFKLISSISAKYQGYGASISHSMIPTHARPTRVHFYSLRRPSFFGCVKNIYIIDQGIQCLALLRRPIVIFSVN